MKGQFGYFCDNLRVKVAQESTNVSVKPDLSEGKCVIIARNVLPEDGGGPTWQQSAIADAPSRSSIACRDQTDGSDVRTCRGVNVLKQVSFP